MVQSTYSDRVNLLPLSEKSGSERQKSQWRFTATDVAANESPGKCSPAQEFQWKCPRESAPFEPQT
jgi:hypothetical protein